MPTGFADDGTGPQTNNDRPQSTKPQVKTAVITGGTGGGRITSGGTITPTKPVSVRPPAVLGDIQVTPPAPLPPPPPQPEPAPIPPAVDTPPPPAPAPIPYNTPVESLPGRKGIKQNPQRYTKSDGEWRISASPDIAYLALPDGTRPALRPVLEGDGVIIKAGEFYLVSRQTLADIQNSGNPHYDISVNGTVAGRPMGKTVPIVELDLTKLIALAAERDEMNRKAAVKDVVYVHETPEQVEGLPKGVVDQINYVLNPKAERPADTFEIWGLTLKGDYNLQPLIIQTAQEDGKLDRTKLKTFLTEVKAKMGLMEEDLNAIKSVFFEGKAPGGSTQTYTVRAQPQGESPVSGSTYIVKTSQTVAVVPTPLQQTQTAVTATVTAVSSSVTEVKELTAATAVVVGTMPEPVVPTKDESLLTKWNAWGLNVNEKSILKEPKYIGSPFGTGQRVTIDGESVRIDLINWPEILCAKLRVISSPLPQTFAFSVFTNNAAQAAQRAKFNEYFGVGKSYSQYIVDNNRRKAEAILTAKRIKELEIKNGKTY